MNRLPVNQVATFRNVSLWNLVEIIIVRPCNDDDHDEDDDGLSTTNSKLMKTSLFGKQTTEGDRPRFAH